MYLSRSELKLKGMSAIAFIISENLLFLAMSTLPNHGLIPNEDLDDYLLGNMSGVFNSSKTNDSYIDSQWIRLVFVWYLRKYFNLRRMWAISHSLKRQNLYV